jgi:epoxide hydrolase-like protein
MQAATTSWPADQGGGWEARNENRSPLDLDPCANRRPQSRVALLPTPDGRRLARLRGGSSLEHPAARIMGGAYVSGGYTDQRRWISHSLFASLCLIRLQLHSTMSSKGVGFGRHLSYPGPYGHRRPAAQVRCGPSPKPYRIEFDEMLRDLGERLSRTRWPEVPPQEPWATGTSIAHMRDLVDYWRDRFDWRAQETLLNRFQQFKVPVGGIALHFIHEQGHHTGMAAAISAHVPFLRNATAHQMTRLRELTLLAQLTRTMLVDSLRN